MTNKHQLTITIEETDGGYQAQVADGSRQHRARGSDPMVAIRGAIAVSQATVDNIVDYNRTTDPEHPLLK